MTTIALAVDMEALVDEVEQRLAATAVCASVISHPDTTPRQAGQIFLLERWLAEGPYPWTTGRVTP